MLICPECQWPLSSLNELQTHMEIKHGLSKPSMTIEELLDEAFAYSRVQSSADPELLKQAIFGMRRVLKEIEYQLKTMGVLK